MAQRNQVINTSLSDWIKKIRFVHWLSKINLFETNDTSDESLHIQYWSTRVYIIIFTVTLCILSIYSLVKGVPQDIEIQYPTLSLYNELQRKYPSINCRCSNISIPYEQFVHFAPRYHQICSSDFVTQQWIDYLYNSTTTHFYFIVDFRLTASLQFRFLRNLCQQSIQAINTSLQSLNNNHFITVLLLEKDEFDIHMKAHIDALKIKTLNKISQMLEFVHNISFANSLQSAPRIDYPLELNNYNENWSFNPDLGRACINEVNGHCRYCSADPGVKAYAGFLGDKHWSTNTSQNHYAYLDIVDGWYTGCLPMDSLFHSTLKSFYNQTAINRILLYFRNSVHNFKCLNISNPTRFPPKSTTLKRIVNGSFIEEWNDQINYELYFNLCTPKSCVYTIEERIIYSMSTILGLYSGLATVLRFIIPKIIAFIVLRRRKTPRTNNTMNWLQKFKQFTRELNLFKSAIHVEPRDIHRQRWSTRIYIIVFIVILIIILLYLLLSVELRRIEKDNLSFSTVSNLQKQTFSSSLQCPCSNMAILKKDFIKFNPIYHEICLYKFTLDYLAGRLTHHLTNDGIAYNFNSTGGYLFKALKVFCELSQITIQTAIYEFGETQLLTKNLLTFEEFKFRMDSDIEDFISITSNQYIDTLILIQETTYANQLITPSETNYRYVVQNKSNNVSVHLITINNQSCSNFIHKECKNQYLLHGTLLDGLYASYYPVQSALLSQIKTLYNTSFMNTFQSPFCEFDSNRCVKALSKLINFPINATFALLSKKLFIELWNRTYNYTSYYERCKPNSCSYMIETKLDIASVISIIISLCSGLSALLRFLSPIIAIIIFSSCYKQTHHERTSENIQQNRGFPIKPLIIKLYKKMYRIMTELNVFENVNKSHPPEEELHTQRRLTRVYIFTFIIILIIILIYIAFIYQTKVITLNKLTFDYYKNYEQLIDCPCTNITIPYHIFINLNISFHEVCSSDFINSHSKWKNMLYSSFSHEITLENKTITFQRMAFAHFQALQIICERIIHVAQNELSIFLNSQFLSISLMKSDVFSKQIDNIFFNFKSNLLSSNYLFVLELIRNIYSSNAYISAYGTNWYPIIREAKHKEIIFMKSKEYNQSSCNCVTSIICVETMNLKLNNESLWSIPGMLSGCLPLDSMLESTLECLYDQICLDKISYALNSSIRYTTLMINHTRFRPINNFKINMILKEFFIEKWIENFSFESYFNACYVQTCSYTISKRFNIFYMLRTIIAFYGGLSLILTLIIPLIYKIIHKCYLKRKNRQVISMNISENQ
ncbi:unnamed protein product [Adineta ricciae]|uniref:Uncharacterized protein n=1 Tax=Adineta ricciae TaxID=249248 RepID=A0A814Z0F4_ADIRI|nr:unnamed protein product [Adineta ricciae]CAF1524447.1 unnamed protein product [Adineta ricciae]